MFFLFFYVSSVCCVNNNLGGVVHWEVLDRRDEALSNQLAVGRRGFSLHKVRLHLSHLGLESSARETKAKEKTDAEHLQGESRFRKHTLHFERTSAKRNWLC